jgi:hypothetical protein
MTDQIQSIAPPAPASASEARARLDTLTADQKWRERLMSGDVAATKEFHELTGMVAEGGDDVEIAMSGKLPDVPDADQKLMAGTASWLRELGLSDGVIRETLEGKGVSQAAFDAVTLWRTQRMRDPAFSQKFLANDAEALRLMTTANTVIANGIKNPEVA